jgi:tRNA(His) 5'-end guanylyltransferase
MQKDGVTILRRIEEIWENDLSQITFWHLTCSNAKAEKEPSSNQEKDEEKLYSELLDQIT